MRLRINKTNRWHNSQGKTDRYPTNQERPKEEAPYYAVNPMNTHIHWVSSSQTLMQNALINTNKHATI